MPLDRIVTLTITGEGTRNQYGEFVPGKATTSRVWAERDDKSLENVVESGGARGISERAYKVRWRSDLASTLPTNISIRDGTQLFQVSNVTEEEEGHGRRRFMVLEVTAEVAA